MADLAREAKVIALLKEGAQNPIGSASPGSDDCSALISLLIEADSFISHMRHRGSWPEDDSAVDALIGRLRQAS